MGLYNAAGTRITRSTFPASADPDPVMVVTAELFYTRRFGEGDKRPEGSIRGIAHHVGDKLRQSEIDKLFPLATAESVLPATGLAAGGTVVTIKGKYLDGVTAVSFGGTAGTSLVVVSDRELRVTTPAKTAGATNVVLTDDSGTITKTNAFTFT